MFIEWLLFVVQKEIFDKTYATAPQQLTNFFPQQLSNYHVLTVSQEVAANKR